MMPLGSQNGLPSPPGMPKEPQSLWLIWENLARGQRLYQVGDFLLLSGEGITGKTLKVIKVPTPRSHTIEREVRRHGGETGPG